MAFGCFNPSQVGYKPDGAHARHRWGLCFNPSQVGYKPIDSISQLEKLIGFNPSQVGYKHLERDLERYRESQFQSLTGRLQTEMSNAPMGTS